MIDSSNWGLSYEGYPEEADNNDAYFCTLGNEGGGDFSQEAVAFSAIKTVPSGSHLNARYLQRRSGAPSGDARPTTADTLWPPFVTKSYCYRPEAAHQHIVGGGWDEWHQSVLAEDGEPFILPEVLKAKVNKLLNIEFRRGSASLCATFRDTAYWRFLVSHLR